MVRGRRNNLTSWARAVARAVRALFAPGPTDPLQPVSCDEAHDLAFTSISKDGFVWMRCRRCGFDFARHPNDWPNLVEDDDQ